MYEIENNVPIKSLMNLKIYPLGDMRVGQSFAAPIQKKPNVRTAIHKFVKQSARVGVHLRFVTRSVIENGEEKIRVWRIE